MKSKGYQIDELPRNSKELMEKVINNPEAMDGSPELNIAHKMTVKEYEEFTPYSQRLEENWGKPPGNLNSDGQNLLIYGKHFGCLLYTSPSPRDQRSSRMPSSA